MQCGAAYLRWTDYLEEISGKKNKLLSLSTVLVSWEWQEDMHASLRHSGAALTHTAHHRAGLYAAECPLIELLREESHWKVR